MPNLTQYLASSHFKVTGILFNYNSQHFLIDMNIKISKSWWEGGREISLYFWNCGYEIHEIHPLYIVINFKSNEKFHKNNFCV